MRRQKVGKCVNWLWSRLMMSTNHSSTMMQTCCCIFLLEEVVFAEVNHLHLTFCTLQWANRDLNIFQISSEFLLVFFYNHFKLYQNKQDCKAKCFKHPSVLFIRVSKYKDFLTKVVKVVKIVRGYS